MKKGKILLTALLLLVSLLLQAEATDGLIVKDGATEQQFAISDIRKIKFSDHGLTVIKTDEVTIEFSSDWQITFREVDNTGIPGISLTQTDGIAYIYATDGKLVNEGKISDIRFGELSKGVYIVVYKGKSFKIIR